MLKKIFLMSLLTLSSVALAPAQDEKTVSIDDSALPRSADAIEKFVPAGWMVEAQVSGDLNGDAVTDTALKLIEKPAANADKDNPASRNRVLLVLLKNADGKFERAATAKKLLQCTGCGGAFYGVMEAPANVEIAKGVLIVKQDFGSREVTEMTFRFRYDPKSKRFTLIGYDSIDRDRATGLTVSQSTNYLTGAQIAEEFQYSQKLGKDVKKSTRKKKVAAKTYYLENINYETFAAN